MLSKKVMIVDDDREFLEELKDVLTSSGYETIAVNDAAAALETADRAKPDVVLLDLKMPKKTGFQLAMEIRQLSGQEQVPVIAMSGFLKDGYNPLLYLCSIRRCLKKPLNPLDVIAEIEDALRQG